MLREISELMYKSEMKRYKRSFKWEDGLNPLFSFSSHCRCWKSSEICETGTSKIAWIFILVWIHWYPKDVKVPCLNCHIKIMLNTLEYFGSAGIFELTRSKIQEQCYFNPLAKHLFAKYVLSYFLLSHSFLQLQNLMTLLSCCSEIMQLLSYDNCTLKAISS